MSEPIKEMSTRNAIRAYVMYSHREEVYYLANDVLRVLNEKDERIKELERKMVHIEAIHERT